MKALSWVLGTCFLLVNHAIGGSLRQEQEWKYLKGSLKYAMQDEKLTRMEMQSAAIISMDESVTNPTLKLHDLSYM